VNSCHRATLSVALWQQLREGDTGVGLTPRAYVPRMSTIDDQIVRIAERRNNLITTGELERLGLSSRSIQRRVLRGQLRRLLPHVYAIVPVPDDVPRRELAVCLSSPNAVLSHSSAAAFWGIRRAPKDHVDVTVPHGAHVRGVSAVVHRSNLIPEHHVVETIDGGRVTSVARTVFDLGGALDRQGHLSVIEDVRNKGLCTDAELGEVYADLRGRGRRGSASWDRLADLTARVSRPTMSELELELQQALIEAGLPLAIQQHPVALRSGRTAYLDLAYLDCRLDIEVDHSAWHGTPSAVERDKARDNGLAVLAWERLRFTERMLERAMASCVANVREVRELRLGQGWPEAA
jgi:very-short-patch-repair endonuclease